ncbi:MAG: pseudouridine synthase [Oscillospiraceae bacterium]
MFISHLCTREASLLSILRHELALSSGLVKRLKWQDPLQLNGVPVHINAPVRHGDRITVDLSETRSRATRARTLPRYFIRGRGLFGRRKTARDLVHPSPRRNSSTLANAVLGYYTRTGQACGVHPVTRLDRDTFGVVLFAKNAYIHDKFCEMQKNHRIFKTYHASVYGK